MTDMQERTDLYSLWSVRGRGGLPVIIAVRNKDSIPRQVERQLPWIPEGGRTQSGVLVTFQGHGQGVVLQQTLLAVVG